MRRAAFLFIGSLAVLMLLAVSMLQSLAIIQRVAAVSSVRGEVFFSRGSGPFVPLGDVKHVLAGDVIRTGPKGSLTLTWVDNHRVRVKPNTTLRVLKCQVHAGTDTQNYLFRLDVGKVWVRVLGALSRKSKFEIETPTATAAVRGTVFSIEVAPDGATQVAVVNGRVDLSGADGQVVVEAGQTARLERGSAPQSANLTPEQKREWLQSRDIAQPSLTLLEPATDKLPPNAQFVLVKGVVERGAAVTVNGQPAFPNVKGRFEMAIPVPSGVHELEITARAEDAKGFETVLVRRLRR